MHLSELNMATLSIVKAALFNRDINISDDMDREQIVDELRAQAIHTLPYEWAVHNLKMNKNIQCKWFMHVVPQVVIWKNLMNEQYRLVELLKNEAISMTILKGAAAAMYYPNPRYRIMGDVDFFVKEDDIDKCSSVMINNGYRLEHDVKKGLHHGIFTKNQVTFEMHIRPAGLPGGEKGKFLMGLFLEGMYKIEVANVDEYQIPVFPRLQNGLILLLHITHHLKYGIGIRQLIDWMMFVDKCITDEVWYVEVEPVLKRVGLARLAMTLTKSCQIFLGLRRNDITWCETVDEEQCTAIIKYFMNQGNFGRKNREMDKGIRVVTKYKSVGQFIKDLQHNGCLNWKATQKFTWLKPFAWLYQLCRYIKIVCSRRKIIKSLKNDIEEGKERMRMIEYVNIFDGSEGCW